MFKDIYSGFLPQLFVGAWITIEIAIGALILGLLIGLIAAACESASIKWLRYLSTTLISIIRGVPELLTIFFIYFGGTIVLTHIMHHYVNVSAFAAGIIALALIFGAYASQTFRGAFLAIPQGQTEAGKALGLSRWQIFKKIQLPQAIRHALPGLSNLWLVLLKDSSLVSLIGLGELMYKAKVAASTTNNPFTFYITAAIFYLVLTSISQIIIQKLTKNATKHLSQ